MKKILFTAVFALMLAACGDVTEEAKTKKVSDEAKVEVKEVKPKKLTLEEKSKKFIDENLEGKTIKDFTSSLIALEDKELEEMIVLGHKDGQQIVDDFDLIGRKAVATGTVLDFVEQSRNTYNDRGKKNGSVTFTRDDKFYIYMGDKNINDFEKIEYDSLIHKDQDIKNFFLGVYPEEIVNFAIIDLDEEATLNIGNTITVEGRIANYVLIRDYSDRSVIKDFHVTLDNATVKNTN